MCLCSFQEWTLLGKVLVLHRENTRVSNNCCHLSSFSNRITVSAGACSLDITAVFLSSGSSEDISSPAAENPQPADSVERSPKERPPPQASPEGEPDSRRSDSSGSGSCSGTSDDDDEEEGGLRKIRSSVAQIKVSMV